MALYGAVQGSRPGLKETGQLVAGVVGTQVVDFKNELQTVENAQISWADAQTTGAGNSAFVSAAITGTTEVTITVLDTSLGASTLATDFYLDVVGEALR